VSGQVLLGEKDLLTMGGEGLRRVRGDRIALVSQDSLSALHPFHTVGAQLVEAVRSHRHTGRREAKARAVDLLDRVGIPQPRQRIEQYPHEFSGGMRQRVMIAMALINDPLVIIADEPTTALDVTVQAQILDLFAELQRDFGMALVMVTHDLGVAARIADDVLVMYAGKCVERGTTTELFTAPRHPYTWGLIRSMPRLDRGRSARLRPIAGQPPSLIDVPSGCAFHPRCEFTELVPGGACASTVPPLEPVADQHLVRCLLDEPRRRQLWTDLSARWEAER
jgi:peptide/nickel transport system ATP-binding protein